MGMGSDKERGRTKWRTGVKLCNNTPKALGKKPCLKVQQLICTSDGEHVKSVSVNCCHYPFPHLSSPAVLSPLHLPSPPLLPIHPQNLKCGIRGYLAGLATISDAHDF